MIYALLNIAMLAAPPVFAWMIHNYLRHGDLSGRRKAVFLGVYIVLMNVILFAASWLRGVKTLDFNQMTVTYRLKWIGLGIVLGFVLPFFVCLLTEEQITLGGFRRYILRFTSDIRRYFPYAMQSARADLESEVSGSYLNWLWWLIEPVCMMLIYAVIFGVIFSASEPYFTVFIFIGLTMWGFFSRNVSASVDIVRGSRDIITRIYMPKFVLLLSKMLVNGFKALVSFCVVICMMIVYRVPVTARMLWAIPVLAVLFLFTFGVGTIMMHYGVYVSDLGYITGIVLQMLSYFTGTFYSLANRIPAPFGEILEQFNPVAFLIAAFRNAMLYGKSPAIPILLLWTFVSVVLVALGAFTVYSNENAYVKVI
ncbi:MAG: ABC transporter permease [Lachnospiraceae bacterium]|nr:ABC transporter permease [Lachnospiraceae bacterium]